MIKNNIIKPPKTLLIKNYFQLIKKVDNLVKKMDKKFILILIQNIL